MKYSQEQFFRLLNTVEAQGGTYLDKVHEDSYYPELSGGAVTDVQMQHLANCRESALFSVPYDGGELEVCAKDDMLGLWPRFKSANAAGAEG